MRWLLSILALGVLLGGCGKNEEDAKAAALRNQANSAQAKLQEKADALAKEAANKNTAPNKPHKP